MRSNAKIAKKMVTRTPGAAKPARDTPLIEFPGRTSGNATMPMKPTELTSAFLSLCKEAPFLINQFREAVVHRCRLPNFPDRDEEVSHILVPIMEDVIWMAVPDEWIASAPAQLNKVASGTLVPTRFENAMCKALTEIAEHRPYVVRNLEDYTTQKDLSYRILLAAQFSFYIANRNVVPY